MPHSFYIVVVAVTAWAMRSAWRFVQWRQRADYWRALAEREMILWRKAIDQGNLERCAIHQRAAEEYTESFSRIVSAGPHGNY